MTFYHKYKEVSKINNSYVCIGLDSDPQKIPSCLSNEENPVLVFNKRIIDETHRHVCCYKPNVAFYLSQGINGMQTLLDTIQYIPNDVPIIFDLKAGDIGNTMAQYAIAAFDKFGADALTINILMGSDVIKACLDIENSFMFALAITSNDSAKEFYKKRLSENTFLNENIASVINKYDDERLGAVVGATREEDFINMRAIMPNKLFLIPGIGAQGGDLESVCKKAIKSPDDPRILVASSRGIIFADKTANFARVAAEKTIELKEFINKYLM